jgi:hypothetical protein
MSRRLDYVIPFDAPGALIYRDLTDRDFWEALMASYQWVSHTSELTAYSTGESGTDIEFRQVMPRSELPPVARAVVPVDLAVTRHQHFDPYDSATNQADGTFHASVPGGLGHFRGRYHLSDTADGSQLRLATECKVHIPFVGGTLEQLILSNITQLFDAEGAFMTHWVAQRHR